MVIEQSVLIRLQSILQPLDQMAKFTTQKQNMESNLSNLCNRVKSQDKTRTEALISGIAIGLN